MEAMGCLWGLAGVAAWLVVSALSLTLGVYALFAYVLYRVGRKFGLGGYPRYLIPVYNLILMCRCAELPGIYVVLLLAPGAVALAGMLLGILLAGPFAGVTLLPLLHPLAWLVAVGAHTVLWGRIAHGRVQQGVAVQLYPSGERARVVELKRAGSAVAEALAAAQIAKPLLQLGLPDAFIEHGDPARLLALQGLDAVGIEASVRGRFGDLIGPAAPVLKVVG